MVKAVRPTQTNSNQELKIALATVNWGDKKQVSTLLNSISQPDSLKTEVFLLENGLTQTKKIVSQLKDFAVPIYYEASEEELTFSVAYNQLITKAWLAGYRWIWVIDRLDHLPNPEFLNYTNTYIFQRHDLVIPNLAPDRLKPYHNMIFFKVDTFIRAKGFNENLFKSHEISELYIRYQLMGLKSATSLDLKHQTRTQNKSILTDFFEVRNPLFILALHKARLLTHPALLLQLIAAWISGSIESIFRGSYRQSVAASLDGFRLLFSRKNE